MHNQPPATPCAEPGRADPSTAPTGLMQPRPLTIAHLIERLELHFGHKTVTTAGAEKVTYREVVDHTRRLATVLDQLEVPTGARVATFASNSSRHLELYLAVPSTKRVLHTINIRLSGEHIDFIINHAQDDVLFIDRAHVADVWQRVAHLPTVRHWVVMPDGTDSPVPDDPRILDYDELVHAAAPMAGSLEDRFSRMDEDLAAGLCYTSGTTGDPKGVLYSHRSTMLHCLVTLSAGLIGIRESDIVMPVVPMFHVSAWGLPYGALMSGASLVMPGASAAPDHLLSLIEKERVTFASGVPTVWTSLVPRLPGYDLTSLRILFGGGSAVSTALSETYRKLVGIPITHSWGMTEMSPIGVIGGLRSQHEDLSPEQQVAVRAAQGQTMPLVRLRLVDPETGDEVARDGNAIGELQAWGPWVASAYYEVEAPDSFTGDGWLRTGDLATIDSTGYLRIVDRMKDLIKSGGEWISSVALESAIASHPDVVEVAVIARADPRWVERPVAYVVLRRPETTSADLLAHLAPRVASWWLPDEFVVVDDLPKTGSGKLAKNALRAAVQHA